jgi:phosphatidylglycerol:prolipoprotein diacylglycerol transferase
VWDVLVPSLTLGIAIGRIGCFLNGCCFGIPTAVPWACVFPEESLAGSIFPHRHIHPTQLYETAAMLILFAWLLYYDTKPRVTGAVTAQFLLYYGIWRFFVEGLRWYESGMILTQSDGFQFTLSRLISLCMVLAGIYLMIRAHKRTVRL